jgi:hypothetical protein
MTPVPFYHPEENCSAADLPPLSEATMAAVRGIYDQRPPAGHHRW